MAVGQPVPLLCVQIHRGEPVDSLPPPAGPDVFLNPFEDAVSLGARLLSWTGRLLAPGRLGSSHDRAPSPHELFGQYRDAYRSPRKHFDWYFGALIDDPLAALAWYASHVLSAGRGHRIRGMTESLREPTGG
jgi:hypothetical protein